MAKRKPQKLCKEKKYKHYKTIEYENGKEIEFFKDAGFVSVAQVEAALQKHFPDYPRKKTIFLDIG